MYIVANYKVMLVSAGLFSDVTLCRWVKWLPTFRSIVVVFNFRGFFMTLAAQSLTMASSFLRFLDHTQRRTRVGRTPLDE